MHVAFVNLTRIVKCFSKKSKFLTNTVFSKKYLLYANVSISIVLSGLGDAIEQNIEIFSRELDKWDAVRTRNMAISGCTVGILCHYWYNFLDAKLPGRSFNIVCKKVLIDQLICSPVTITLFFFTLAVLENQSRDELIHEIKQKAWKLYVAEWVIWPPAQYINFYILPTKYRVLYDNTISLGYDIYTSYVVQRKTHPDTGTSNTICIPSNCS